jgi:tetratricopeptide (TPR) repeat protein
MTMTRNVQASAPVARAVALALLLSGASLGASGCAGDEGEGAESGSSEGSSGGETTMAPATATGLEGAPGSVAPREPEIDPDDPMSDPNPQPAPPPAGGTATAPAAPTQAAYDPNRWGARDNEACRPAARPPMSAAAQTSIRRGVSSANANDVDGARTAFMAALSADPRSYHAAFNLGVIADRAGNETQAMEYYRQALRIQEDYEHAVRGLVAIHIRRGDRTGALTLVEPLARRFGSNLELQAIHAEVLVQNQRYEQAWDAARRALRCDERFVPALRALVKASLAQDRKELAASILANALSAAPNDAELHYLNAQILGRETGRAREQVAALERAVSLRPSYSEARMELGTMLLRSGNYTGALAQFEAVSRLNPTLPAVHLNLGDAYRSLRRWTEAKASYDRVVASSPNMPEVHFNLGLMYRAAGAEFPGLDLIQSLQRARESFARYRNLMGPRLARTDPSEQYLSEIDRAISRAQRAAEEEAREAERAANPEPAATEEEAAPEEEEWL